ncbi:MAG: glutamine--tRNA ligase/YqeY domain fusion protein [Lachnospiraceae bacterium]
MENEAISKNFIEQIIDKDIEEGHCKVVKTRFPPEPNGYLHIGHAKSILLNYGLAVKYNGKFNMRFDDTNPTKEKEEFVESIEKDVAWLGADWGGEVLFASDYFEQMYEAAVKLIKRGKAYVCDLTADEIREYRGTLTEPGKESPYRNRSIEENLALFEDMKNGKFEDGTKVLRAKIDMASSNINMRDPVIYRVAHMTHHRTGDKWCIYPMYDFAHPIEDAIEGITHSICTLEFEDHRPLYDWVLIEAGFKNSPEEAPKQIEFAKLYLTNVVTGKRYIKKLVEEKIVDGWDDPRLVSLSALRRRGFTPESIKMFVDLVGVTKSNGSVEYPMLEYCIREDLKLKVNRMMAVLDPVKLIIDNYPEEQVEYFDVPNNQENEELGSRKVAFCKELYIEREDFMEEPPKKYFRLFPGNEVRLMNAYFVKCESFVKDENGRVTEIHCTYDPATRSGLNFTERKVKGTIHWVSARHAVKVTARLYENIIDEEKGVYNEDGSLNLNPNSLTVVNDCYVEAGLAEAKPEDKFQFVRNGYFCADIKDSTPGNPVFNRIVSLKSSFKLN